MFGVPETSTSSVRVALPFSVTFSPRSCCTEPSMRAPPLMVGAWSVVTATFCANAVLKLRANASSAHAGRTSWGSGTICRAGWVFGTLDPWGCKLPGASVQDVVAAVHVPFEGSERTLQKAADDAQAKSSPMSDMDEISIGE